jgi:hypothetical protein
VSMRGAAKRLGIAWFGAIALLPVLTLGHAQFVRLSTADRLLAVDLFIAPIGRTLSTAANNSIRFQLALPALDFHRHSSTYQ